MSAPKKPKLKSTPSPLDFFETPASCVSLLLDLVDEPNGVWVDLGCGRGAIGKVLHETWGMQGIGVEFLPERVAQARATGAYLAVFTGDVTDSGLRRELLEEINVQQDGILRAGLVIANPPFETWEKFGKTAAWLDPDVSALLLPAMAWERRKTKALRFTQRAALIDEPNAGRYDLADRPAFVRPFTNEIGETVYVAKGEAPSAYAWRVTGEAHAGRWAWLRGVS